MPNILTNPQRNFDTKPQSQCPMCNPRLSKLLYKIAAKMGISVQDLKMETMLGVYNKHWDFKKWGPKG
jgi:hypothetical protein